MVNYYHGEGERKDMEVISAREFRSNQSKYLRRARQGQSVILTSREGSFKITPIEDKDILVTNEILSSLDEVKAHLQGQVQLPNAKDIVF